jgi:alcohol dehydrogenase (cytochrome c)
MMYFPLHNICMTVTTIPNSDAIEAIYGFGTQYSIAPGMTNVGVVEAISVETGATAWKHERRAGTLSLVATGGGLVFGGDANGRFLAFDDRSGKVLWEINLGSPVSGYPVTFAVDGKQYVAVSTGPSLVANAAVRLTPELKPSSASQMYVFALP